MGLSTENFEGSSLKNDVLQKQREAEGRLEARQEGINDSQSSLEKKVNTARSENVVWGNAKQVGSSIAEAAIDIYEYATSNDFSKK